MKTEPTAEEAAHIRASIQHMLGQIDQADERIKRYQDQIDRLKVETRVLLDELEDFVQVSTHRARAGSIR